MNFWISKVNNNNLLVLISRALRITSVDTIQRTHGNKGKDEKQNRDEYGLGNLYLNAIDFVSHKQNSRVCKAPLFI